MTDISRIYEVKYHKVRRIIKGSIKKMKAQAKLLGVMEE